MWFTDGPLPNTLQHVEVPVISNVECEAMYGRAGYIENIPNIFICAGVSKGGKDSCEVRFWVEFKCSFNETVCLNVFQGDSGGPLVVEENGRWSLIGIISWGIGCASPNQPGVYTRITEFAKWIRQIIEYWIQINFRPFFLHSQLGSIRQFRAQLLCQCKFYIKNYKL